MSPQSRGRKKKPRNSRKPRTQELNPYAMVLRQFGPVAQGEDCFEVELFTSSVLGAMYQPGAPLDPIRDLVAFLGQKPTSPALGLLRAVAQLGITDEQRADAADEAQSLADNGVPEPRWTAPLTEVTFVDAWQLADVYGDQATVLFTFERATAKHAVFALVDFNILGGWVKDISVTDEPAEVLRDMRRSQLESGGLARVESLAPRRARQLIEDGIAAVEVADGADVSEDYIEFRALALARCRVLPEPSPPELEPEFSDVERGALVKEFLRDCAADVEDSEATRRLARLLVDFGCDCDAGRPTRVGPGKLETFLLRYVPGVVVLEDADRVALPDVVRSWARWAAARADLPDAAVAELDGAVRDIVEEFDEVYDDAANDSPGLALLSGLPEGADQAEAESMVARRMFAMPYFGTRIGDDDFPRLDPSDPDERHLLVVGEHPEYHAALDDPDFGGEIDGVNPRLHLALDDIVVAQLWDDDPPAVWRAAQRLQASGMPRLDVIHRIAAVLVEQVWHAMADDEPVDPTGYVDALNALAAPRKRSRAKAAGTSLAADAVLQLKITLHGSKPPIWRRLRLPASTPLDALHHVIQASFGWTDSHLHAFEAGGERYAPSDFELDATRASDGVALSALVGVAGAKLSYEYDFGDSWRHDIALERVHMPDGVPHAVCTAGRRAGPAEDSGGIGGWAYLCEVLADPGHPEHADQLEWLGYVPDPTAFDQEAVNRALARIPLCG